MLYACDQRFDVTENLKNFCELNKALEQEEPEPTICSRQQNMWLGTFHHKKKERKKEEEITSILCENEMKERKGKIREREKDTRENRERLDWGPSLTHGARRLEAPDYTSSPPYLSPLAVPIPRRHVTTRRPRHEHIRLLPELELAPAAAPSPSTPSPPPMAASAMELSLLNPAATHRHLGGLPLARRSVVRFRRVSASAAAAAPPKSSGPPKKRGKTEIQETLLTPRFYTTDFDEMERLFNAEINKQLNQAEFDALLQEFKTDYNQTHFVRNPEFKAAADKMEGPLRQIFVEFLERSCTAEFSGFLLYKELGRRLKVPSRFFLCLPRAFPRPPGGRALMPCFSSAENQPGRGGDLLAHVQGRGAPCWVHTLSLFVHPTQQCVQLVANPCILISYKD